MDDVRTTHAEPRRRWQAIVLALALVAAAIGFAQPWQRNDDPTFGIVDQVQPESAAAADLETGPTVGQLAPNFLLETMDGQTIRLSDLRGTPVFVNFWATWCIFCVTEMPAMQRLADQYEGQLVIVGVNVGQAAHEADEFVASTGIRYPLALDRETEVTEVYEVRSMPTSLFVDAAGIVRVVHYGPLTSAQMEEMTQSVLAPSDDTAFAPRKD